MVFKMKFYGLNSPGSAFRENFTVLLNDIRYTPSRSEPEIWMRVVIRPDGTEY